MRLQLQQGDVLIEKISKIPEEVKEAEDKGILAYGEVTGHKHKLEDTNIKTFKDKDGNIYFQVEESVKLKHEEHNMLTIEPGIYKSWILKEKDWVSGMVRKVID